MCGDNFGLVLLLMLVASNKTGKKDKSVETETVGEWRKGDKMFKYEQCPYESVNSGHSEIAGY